MHPQKILLAVSTKCIVAMLEAHPIGGGEKCKAILQEYDRCCMERVISPYRHPLTQQLGILLTADVRNHLQYVHTNKEMSRDDEPTEMCSSCGTAVSIYCMHTRNVGDDICDDCLEMIYD